MNMTKLVKMLQLEQASESWFDRLNDRERIAYLKAHPASVYNINADDAHKLAEYHEGARDAHYRARDHHHKDAKHILADAHHKTAELHNSAANRYRQAVDAYKKHDEDFGNEHTDRAENHAMRAHEYERAFRLKHSGPKHPFEDD